MKKVKVIVLRTAGTNCDKETEYAFRITGADTNLLHINEFINRKKSFDSYKILVIPGGFSYGDDIASGKVFANELIYKLRDSVEKFVKDGKLIIGICNGFQVLVKTGLLPHSTLTFNDSGKFEDRWVYLKNVNNGNCVFTKGIEKIYLPIAHGEGKFITDRKTLNLLKKNDCVVFKYVDEKGREKGYPCNPNGSMEGIAGICSKSGNIFGLMPHPERHIIKYQHPRWTRLRPFLKKETAKKTGYGGQARYEKKGLPSEVLAQEGDGVKIFRNAVEYATKHL